MEIAATGQCWMSATMDASRTIERLMTAGDRVQLQAENEILLKLGNAGSINYTLNGAAGRSLGAAGQVVSERIDRANYQTYISR
jgi:hypothetical protein